MLSIERAIEAVQTEWRQGTEDARRRLAEVEVSRKDTWGAVEEVRTQRAELLQSLEALRAEMVEALATQKRDSQETAADWRRERTAHEEVHLRGQVDMEQVQLHNEELKVSGPPRARPPRKPLH
jgi:hypothetical protein